jgi:hypothetical protein
MMKILLLLLLLVGHMDSNVRRGCLFPSFEHVKPS